jgi:hypothetical protein
MRPRSGLAERMVVWNGSVRFIVSSGQPNSGPGELTMGRTARISFSPVCRGVSRANTGQMPRYGRRFVVLNSAMSCRCGPRPAAAFDGGAGRFDLRLGRSVPLTLDLCRPPGGLPVLNH